MGMWLKQSTAVTIKLGPFLDDTDGKTAETALTISQADIRLSKNGGAFAQTNNAAGATHDEGGEYGIPLDATDTNTLGTLKVRVHETGALPCWNEFMVVPANVWDSMFGADKLDVNVEEWNATAVPAEHTAGYPIVTIKDGTGTGEINTNAGAVALVDAVTTVNGLAANVITAAATAADFGAELATAIWTDTTAGDFTVAASIGKSIMNGVALGTGLTINAYTGNTPQTGDSFARIGAAGASLTDLGGMSTTMKAQVQTEAEDALVTHRLDELLNADSDIDGAAPPTVGSVFHELMSKTAGSFTFDQTTDSNEAIRDNMGTAQTGDSYAIVNSGTHGNAALKTLIDAVDNFVDTEVAAILALLDDPRTEPGQGAPPVNPDLATKIDYLYKAWRNRVTQTSSTYSLYADDATTVDQKAAVSDDGTTFDRGEIATGP